MSKKTDVDLTRLARILAAKARDKRIVVAIAGAPGSGKSTMAEALTAQLTEDIGVTSQVLPMDGFHYDNAVLEPLGLLPRKGAPETFDVAGLASVLTRLGQDAPEDVAVPVFDRSQDLARAGGRIIRAGTRVIMVEGNYLLLENRPWAELRSGFDVTVSIQCDISVLRERLLQRWLDHGYVRSEALKKAQDNDLPNAELVTAHSARADFVLTSGATG